MKRYFEKLNNAPLYLKIIAAVVAALIIATALSYKYFYYMYVQIIEDRLPWYPWISGGTAVTYVEAPNKTCTLRVSPRTGAYLKVAPKRLGRMESYYYDGISDWDSRPTPWYEAMNHYFYYEKNDNFDFIKPRNWSLEWPKVTHVVIDDGVKHIGNYAFYRSTNFFGDRIPDPKRPLPARYLESIIIANSVDTIGESAFEGCGSLPLLTIPDGVKWIGRRAFYDCNVLSPVTIPKSVEYIGEEAFEGTVHIDVAADNPNYTSIDGVLFNKNKIETKER